MHKKTHAGATCSINNCSHRYFIPSLVVERNSFICPLAKRKKILSFSLQGDWKCSKLIQQKCSVGVLCFEASSEFLWSRSLVLSEASEGHALFRCGCIYFPWLTHPGFCCQPTGQEEALCQTASRGLEAETWIRSEQDWMLWFGNIIELAFFPGVNSMNESVPVWFDHVVLWLPHFSLASGQPLMWSQGLMRCLVITYTSAKHLTFRSVLPFSLTVTVPRVLFGCSLCFWPNAGPPVSSVVSLDWVVLLERHKSADKIYSFLGPSAWFLDVLLYFNREHVLDETLMEKLSVHWCARVCSVLTASPLLCWRTVIKSWATKGLFSVTMVLMHSGVERNSSLHRFCYPFVLYA